MDRHILQAFAEAMEKRAISAGRTLAVLRARVGQGARVAPRLLHGVEQAAASGATTTPAMRRLALSAGQDARAATATARAAANPVTQASRARVLAGYEKAVSNPAATRQMTAAPLRTAADQGATGMSGVARPYTTAHINAVAGGALPASPQLRQHDRFQAFSRSVRADLRKRPTPTAILTSPGMGTAATGAGGTQLGNRVRARRPASQTVAELGRTVASPLRRLA